VHKYKNYVDLMHKKMHKKGAHILGEISFSHLLPESWCLQSDGAGSSTRWNQPIVLCWGGSSHRNSSNTNFHRSPTSVPPTAPRVGASCVPPARMQRCGRSKCGRESNVHGAGRARRGLVGACRGCGWQVGASGVVRWLRKESLVYAIN
jgi:hypothetical protein